MNKFALLFVAALFVMTTPVSAGDRSAASCSMAQDGRPVDPTHPLVDGFIHMHVLGMYVSICARHASGEAVTRDEAIEAARIFLKDNKADCDYVDAKHSYVDEHKREGEWQVHLECKKRAGPLFPPFVEPPPLKE